MKAKKSDQVGIKIRQVEGRARQHVNSLDHFLAFHTIS